MSTTPGTPAVQTITLEEAIEAANAYRTATQNVGNIESDIKFEQSKIGAKYQMKLEKAKTECEESKTVLENYVLQNRDDLMGPNKSIDFSGIKVGFRKATAKLVLKGKNTWDKVKEKLRNDATLTDYLVLKEDVDKTRLKKEEAAVLKILGVEVVQPETFYAKV